MVGPADVKDLQTKVHDYRTSLQASVDKAAGTGAALPLTGPYNVGDWGNLVGRCVQFESEGQSDLNPLNYLLAGSAYDRGRALIGELDSWRDELARKSAPNVPAPLPVPNSQVDMVSAIGWGLAAIVAILVLRELR